MKPFARASTHRLSFIRWVITTILITVALNGHAFFLNDRASSASLDATGHEKWMASSKFAQSILGAERTLVRQALDSQVHWQARHDTRRVRWDRRDNFAELPETARSLFSENNPEEARGKSSLGLSPGYDAGHAFGDKRYINIEHILVYIDMKIEHLHKLREYLSAIFDGIDIGGGDPPPVPTPLPPALVVFLSGLIAIAARMRKKMGGVLSY